MIRLIITLNSSVHRKSLLPEFIKRIRRQLNKKRSVKRLYKRKKLPININNSRQRNRRQLYNVNYGRNLIER
jgi:hypothetical protein